MVNKSLFSSASAEWSTPAALFEQIAAIWGPFDLDVCATAQNAKAPRYFTKADDGLAQPWGPWSGHAGNPARVWMNPPYGREIGRWMEKAFLEAQRGNRVVCLVPARTDTAWFHDFARRGSIFFIRGRIKFERPDGPAASAPFPSCLVVFPRLPGRVDKGGVCGWLA